MIRIMDQECEILDPDHLSALLNTRTAYRIAFDMTHLCYIFNIFGPKPEMIVDVNNIHRRRQKSLISACALVKLSAFPCRGRDEFTLEIFFPYRCDPTPSFFIRGC